MNKTFVIMAAITTSVLSMPAASNAQLLSANIGGIGASVGGSTYSAPAYRGYYPAGNYNYYQNTYPVQQTVRYSQTTRYPASSYYSSSSSYNSYPAYYYTGYSYPATSYNYYNYSTPTYGTGVSVGVGL